MSFSWPKTEPKMANLVIVFAGVFMVTAFSGKNVDAKALRKLTQSPSNDSY